jgi:hypothetical protein
MERRAITTRGKDDAFLKDLLAISDKEDLVNPGEGFWVDHWTYNLDLIENYLAIYPENLKDLLVKEKTFTFYDTCERIVPRSEKHVYCDGKIRQYGSVVKDWNKRDLIDSRQREARKVRTKHGTGAVYKTTLLVKLLSLAANKAASLDPFGVGIEMEANKPGWCDSLNNLPGIFGSSTSETFELKRLVSFLEERLEEIGVTDSLKIKMPEELAAFIKHLSETLKRSLSDDAKGGDYAYWDKSSDIKEEYRKRVWKGFSGKEKALSAGAIKEFLRLSSRKLDSAIAKGMDAGKGMPYTYFYHEATQYKFIYEKGKKKVNDHGYPLVRVTSFDQFSVAHSLEGPVHAMKVEKRYKERKVLYNAVRKSDIYDRNLRMYKLNASLAGMPYELGRLKAFTPGWLENESIWLHMEYKYLLEVLRGGLYDDFFGDIKHAMVAFMDPRVYGRSILENSSFIASSVHPDADIHGRGFVARLSGSTTEFLSIWINMVVGEKPFRLSEGGNLELIFKPVLPSKLFTKKGDFRFMFLGRTLVTYHNPKRRNTYASGAVSPVKYVLKRSRGEDITVRGGSIPSPHAEKVRNGGFASIDIYLG